MKKKIALTVTTLISICIAFVGCAKKDNGIAILWTNQAEFASYTELFNANQSKYRIIVEYKDNPAEALITAKKTPDLVIGPWLKGEKTRSHLIPIDYLFNELKIAPKQFYKPLLELGNIRGRQYLLPVSFNLPALIFSPDKQLLISNDFSLSLDQIKALSKEFNIQKKGIYTKMGFSPRWNIEFPYLIALLFDVEFEEQTKLFGWNQSRLADAISYMKDWTKTVNSSITAEDDFQFKYLYDPPYTLVTGGKSLFSYMPSNELFVLPQDKIQNIDFRWITRANRTCVNDGIIYTGICTKAPHLEAAEAFLIWFFSEKTQKELLNRARIMDTTESTFGISGGFSSLREVNEKIFPLHYPSLLGHQPPADSLAVPHILPNNWEILKSEIVIPYLSDTVGAPEGKENTIISLEERISAWIKSH